MPDHRRVYGSGKDHDPGQDKTQPSRGDDSEEGHMEDSENQPHGQGQHPCSLESSTEPVDQDPPESEFLEDPWHDAKEENQLP